MRFKIFENYPQLKYGLSERKDGNMKISADQDIPPGQKSFFKSLGVDSGQVVRCLQTHSSNVFWAGIFEGGLNVTNTDALATEQPGVFLSITVADCFPVFAYDPKTQIYGIAHAGWRGILKGIVPNLLKMMVLKGASLNTILIGVGPGINKCHFEIKDDVLEDFKSYPNFIIRNNQQTFIDLPGIIKEQAVVTGVPENNIEFVNECTYELETKYFSSRRDKANPVEAMVAFIAVN